MKFPIPSLKWLSFKKCKKVFRLLWSDFKDAYSNKYLLKWSIWWAFATCGNFQVGNFIQPLETGEKMWLNEKWGKSDRSREGCIEDHHDIFWQHLRTVLNDWITAYYSRTLLSKIWKHKHADSDLFGREKAICCLNEKKSEMKKCWSRPFFTVFPLIELLFYVKTIYVCFRLNILFESIKRCKSFDNCFDV